MKAKKALALVAETAHLIPKVDIRDRRALYVLLESLGCEYKDLDVKKVRRNIKALHRINGLSCCKKFHI